MKLSFFVRVLFAFLPVLGYTGYMKADLSLFAHRRVSVALSGGGDSVALFLLLRENAEKLDISLSAVNIEHGIRGADSLADTAFVKKLCGGAGVPLFCFEADIPARAAREGIGVEEAARAFRREVFFRLIREDKTDFVATAHHAGDNAESVLFDLFRGASLTGAGGIRYFVPVEGDRGIVRPLLACTKAEIMEFLAVRGASWREDASNADPAYARNFLRHKILAPAQQAFPACEKNLYAFSRAAREDDDFLYSLTDAYVEEGEEFYIRADAPRPVLRRCCVRAMQYFGIQKDYTSAHISAMCALLSKENGAEADLPAGVRAVLDYGRLAVYRPKTQASYSYPFAEGEFDCGRFILRLSAGKARAAGNCLRVLYFDRSRLPSETVIRPRKEGDVFKKFGGGTKKLKEFMIDQKIPARMRGDYPLIAAGSEVFAVCGIEISDKIRVPRRADGTIEKDGNVFTAVLYRRGEDICITT